MRDIVAVIDAVIAEVPRTSIWAQTHCVELSYLRDDASHSAPEALPALWGRANAIVLVLTAKDAYPDAPEWQSRVANIWSGRHHEAPGAKLAAMQSLSAPGVWVIEQSPPSYGVLARFYGPFAEARAREYAAWKNGEVGT